MRKAFITAVAAILLVSTARAKIIQITGTGFLSSSSGLDSSVQVGTPFTVVFDVNTATPLNPPAEITAAVSDPSVETISYSFGDYSGSFQSHPLEDISVSQDFSPGMNEYLYNFQAASNDPGVDGAIALQFQGGPVSPSDAAPTLKSLAQLPQSYFLYADFDYSTYIQGGPQGVITTGEADATSMSFTTQVLPAPEPSIYIMMVLGFIPLAVFSKRIRSILQA